MKIGTLYGISVGPGDPELITLKGLQALQRVPIVAFPAGVQGKPGIAQQIIAQWLNPEQLQLALTFPYVQDLAVLQESWQIAAQQVWHYLRQGKDVAFACEGDVSFYSTFTYLSQTLQQLYPETPVQLVPGVSSPMAAAAVLGIPLTVRQERLVVLPALYALKELEDILNWAEVVVLLKVSSMYEQVWQILQQRGLLSNSYAVERATLPQQKIYSDLSNHPNLKLPYFSLLIVHVTDKRRAH